MGALFTADEGMSASSLPGGTLGRAYRIRGAPFCTFLSAWGEIVLWRFEFYSTGQGITESVKVASESERLGLEEVIQQAQSMMSIVTFAFGKANRCLLTSDDGTIVKEVISYARTR
jgi:hypothetical protein